MNNPVAEAERLIQLGEKHRARNLLIETLRSNLENTDAWMLLASTLDDPEQREKCLQKALDIQSKNGTTSNQDTQTDNFITHYGQQVIARFGRRRTIVGIIGVILLSCCGLSGLGALLSGSNGGGEGIVAVTETRLFTRTPRQSTVATTPTELPDSTDLPTQLPTPSNTPQPTATSQPDVASITTEIGEVSGELATVTQIIDGDTIEVALDGSSYRVRYIGIDTPERGAPYSGEATEANRQLVEGQTVIMVKDVSETDRFGRLLRFVYLLNGTFVNAELVRSGFAQVTTFPPDVNHQQLFLNLQAEARTAGLGLWQEMVVQIEPTDTPLPANTPQPTNTQAPLPTNTPALAPTSPPAPTEPPATSGNVIISSIFYDGIVTRVESDEYAEITNIGGSSVNLSGWRLNADDAGQDFIFPSFELQPGQSCRIYTNEAHPETCGFSFNSGRAIWRNTGECGHLFDETGVEVSTWCY